MRCRLSLIDPIRPLALAKKRPSVWSRADTYVGYNRKGIGPTGNLEQSELSLII
jgi:hypothetical protein